MVLYEQMFVLEGSLLPTERIILGIDPGLANTGWGVVRQSGARLQCLAYGCVSTSSHEPLAARLRKIYEQTTAVVQRFKPSCVGIETVWFGQNITAAFATGQARGAALAACGSGPIEVGEFSPRQIKLAVVGTGSADKAQVNTWSSRCSRSKSLPSQIMRQMRLPLRSAFRPIRSMLRAIPNERHSLRCP